MNAHIHTCKGGGKIVRVYLASCQSNLLFPFQLTLLHTSYTHRYKSTGASRIDGHTRLYTIYTTDSHLFYFPLFPTYLFIPTCIFIPTPFFSAFVPETNFEGFCQPRFLFQTSLLFQSTLLFQKRVSG